ncbi:MAG: GerW family sporulation protein [Bacillota bacterium]|nr:GerW family sporulation protein [Bacillota bacterium]MDD3298261.1 GerW family sporulation protein [Bacillota bacterium]MDD3851384.1 GerW family sporulation protein [Bacillota bacterium]MDD4707820.1 GerW family sporulation protein [Bacillota bacterium]
MSEHPIQALMKTTMESIKQMVDVNTIVGDAVETVEGTVIIPISRVAFGFASGGGEYQMQDGGNKGGQGGGEMPFAGGAGAGVSVQPVAFMVVGKEHIKLMPANSSGMIERIIEMSPQIIDELQGVVKKMRIGTCKHEDEAKNLEQ